MLWHVFVFHKIENRNLPVRFASSYWYLDHASKEPSPIHGWNLGNVLHSLKRSHGVESFIVTPVE